MKHHSHNLSTIHSNQLSMVWAATQLDELLDHSPCHHCNQARGSCPDCRQMLNLFGTLATCIDRHITEQRDYLMPELSDTAGHCLLQRIVELQDYLQQIHSLAELANTDHPDSKTLSLLADLGMELIPRLIRQHHELELQLIPLLGYPPTAMRHH